MSIFWLFFSRLGSPTYSDSYLNWYNPRSCPFCVHFTPYPNCEDAIFVRWMECNTPLLEYILSCVFRFFDHIFQFTSCIYFVLWIIYMVILPLIQIRGLEVSPSLNRGPEPRVLLDLVFLIFRESNKSCRIWIPVPLLHIQSQTTFIDHTSERKKWK